MCARHLDSRHLDQKELHLADVRLDPKRPRLLCHHPQVDGQVPVASRLLRVEGGVEAVLDSDLGNVGRS